MTLERAIHVRWAADEALTSLLPAARLTTGRASAGPLPYATLTRRRNRPLLRTNTGDVVDEADVAIDVWHDDYDAGRAIAEQVRLAFDRAAFDLDGGGRVVQMRQSEDSASQESDGTWRFSLRFLAQVHRRP